VSADSSVLVNPVVNDDTSSNKPGEAQNVPTASFPPPLRLNVSEATPCQIEGIGHVD